MSDWRTADPEEARAILLRRTYSLSDLKRLLAAIYAEPDDPTLDAPLLTDADAPDERFTHATDPDDIEFEPDPFDVGYDFGWEDGNEVGYADGRNDR